jgi:hypothetical protein
VKRIRMVLMVVAIMALMAVVSSPSPAMAQAYCSHDFCDWYQSCKWEFWGWDSATGWVLVSTDGNC